MALDGEDAGAEERGIRNGGERLAEGLQQITDSNLAYLSLEKLLTELLERIRTILDADTAAVLLLDRDRGVLLARAAKGIEEEVREGVQIPLGRGFAGRIAAERRAIAIEDVDHSMVMNPLLRERRIRSLLGVPLIVGGNVIGVLHVGTLVPRIFDDEDRQLLQLAADRAALVIDNAQGTEQRAMTSVLQRTLLPEALPEIPGLRFSAKYLPAQTGMRLGGDWYDVFDLPDGRIAFVIGDVVGRGVIAASVMGEIRVALRAYAQVRRDLSELMSLLNDLLISLGRRRSATAAILAYDLETEELIAVSAGHVPVLKIDPNGETEFVANAGGPPLGTWAGWRYSAERLSLPTGSSLVLYTDGLVERRGELIDHGLERLATAAVALDTRRTLADKIYRRLVAVGTLEDDMALLAIETLALGPTLTLSLEATPAVLAGLRRSLARWLAEQGASDIERFDIALAASEAAANAVEHAYGPVTARFDVEARIDGRNATIEVSDRGAWREQAAFRTGGRGLEIMRALMDDVHVDATDRGTRVMLSKRLGGSDA